MMKCIKCGSDKDVYKKRQICKKCYQKEYAKAYYKKNADAIKQASTENYTNNRKDRLLKMKERREQQHFDSKRLEVLKRDNYTCTTCKRKLDDSQLTVHHKDGNDRGQSNPNNDIDNLITQCRKCHCNEHRGLLNQTRMSKQRSQWSYKYDKCIKCGTTDIKHQGKGLCKNCHAALMREKKKMKI